jgi:hypothetical protein
MAIFLYVKRLSMGNTCRLPLLISHVRQTSYNEAKNIPEAALPTSIGMHSRPRCLEPVLHTLAAHSTGCAQRSRAFELRRKRLRVQS